MGKKEILDELKKKLKSLKTQMIFDVIMLILGLFTLIFVIGIIFIILGAVGLSKHSKEYSNLKIKIAEIT